MTNEGTQQEINEGIFINNAGLVLLWPYFMTLFERLGLDQEDTFVSAEAQERAVHYLQYVVTGTTETEEHLLPLNKLLVGLPLQSKVTMGFDITDDEKQLIEGMLTAAINHWTALGNTSIDGFRGSFLLREGVLRQSEDRWQLTVEKRAYDMLMDQLPWSISIVNLPFMQKPIYVSWR